MSNIRQQLQQNLKQKWDIYLTIILAITIAVLQVLGLVSYPVTLGFLLAVSSLITVTLLRDRWTKEELKRTIKDVATANPADIQEVFATQLAISSSYYVSVLQQSQRSFIVAIIFATVGLGFFMAAITFLVYKNPASFVNVSLIGGALTEFLSAINFYLYGRATRQLETFHIRLDGIQRFIIANSICEILEGEIKQTTRAELVLGLVTTKVPSAAFLKDDDGKNKEKTA